MAAAGTLLEILQRELINAHDTADFVVPLALALMCQPSTDEVQLTLHLLIWESSLPLKAMPLRCRNTVIMH